MQPEWVIYLLECADGTYYTGITKDVHTRMGKHNQGKASKYTRSRLPVKLKCVSSKCYKEGKAKKLERAIKKLPREKKVEFFKTI